ncbi:MAG: hypothetical protein ABW072_18665 [Sedimenticola sp.]
MAEPDVGQVFQNLAVQMGNVSTALGAQGVNQIIDPFEGDAKKFKEWVKSIEKYAVLMELDDHRVKRVAYQASRGPVSDFIKRYSGNAPGATWGQMKIALASRFSEVTDAQHAFLLLRKVRQKFGETVQVYAERLLALAEDAFDNQQGQPVQQQLIDTFVDGLAEDSLKLKVLRENPNTLEAAVTAATNEQNLRKRFNLRTHNQYVPEDNKMEVDHYRPTQRCFKCHKVGHKSRDCKVKSQIHAVAYTGGQKESDKVKDMLCWYCNKKGHFKRECRKRQADLGRCRNSYRPREDHMKQEN